MAQLRSLSSIVEDRSCSPKSPMTPDDVAVMLDRFSFYPKTAALAAYLKGVVTIQSEALLGAERMRPSRPFGASHVLRAHLLSGMCIRARWRVYTWACATHVESTKKTLARNFM